MRMRSAVFLAALFVLTALPSFCFGAEKTISVDVGDNGKVNGHEEDYRDPVPEDGSYELIIEANEGYVIHSLLINEEPLIEDEKDSVLGKITAQIKLQEIGNDVSVSVMFRVDMPEEPITEATTATEATDSEDPTSATEVTETQEPTSETEVATSNETDSDQETTTATEATESEEPASTTEAATNSESDIDHGSTSAAEASGNDEPTSTTETTGSSEPAQLEETSLKVLVAEEVPTSDDGGDESREEGKGAKDAGGPKTGDKRPLAMPMIILGLSLCITILSVIKNRRYRV